MESKLLSYLCEHPELLPRAPQDIVTDERRDVLEAIRKCNTQYGVITPEGIAAFTNASLAGLFVPVVEDITPVMDRLHKLRKQRRLMEIGQALVANAQAGIIDTQFLADLMDDPLVEQEGNLDGSALSFLRTLEDKKEGKYDFISTGYKTLDVIMGGEWPRGKVSIVIGDPGISKTTLACSSMLKMAQQNHPSLFFSLEMSKADLVARWAASLTEIDSTDIIRGAISDEDLERINAAVAEITALPMYVFDTTTTMGIDDIVPIIRQYVKKNVRVVFIDYLQIMNVGEDRNKELGRVARLLKNVAKELGIHICIISQKNGKDGVWVIRDSGEVPAAVDIIMNLSTEMQTDIRIIDFHFTKNRSGRTGHTTLTFNAPFLRYENY